ncbi:branched-chain amino acid ABC transporter permease [Microbacterium immunditiarum]|uniref:Branched-chain amino acid transport system permease protein n=1 Tax=Microbacterium immunditiarum TaxID=337480 RepID=A0A7Y9GKZ5_9MICO|nr:branched-chain amino acid ABC transporter permease [Microbacterium immunditiarum]NYE18409.1 branched-chain amino acid transport system permease protein [Microbacterium immunditiarum]
MDLYISAAISGVAVGLLYGMIGFAIVMLYKSTGVANFAQGTLATLGAFVAWALVTDAGLPLLAAVPIALVASGVFGIIVYFLVIRPRASAGNLNITVRTLGLSLLLLAIMEWRWGALAPYRHPTIVQGEGIQIASVVLPAQSLLIAAVAAVIMVVLWALFRYTRAGLSFRALAEQPDTARLLGLRATRLSAATWGLSAILGTIVGVLLAPSAFLAPAMMEPYLLFTFTGIVLGGLTSLPGALLGSVIVGIISNVTIVAFNLEAGVLVVFAILLIVMLLRPQGLLGKQEAVRL